VPLLDFSGEAQVAPQNRFYDVPRMGASQYLSIAQIEEKEVASHLEDDR
jgi:hypothetical protein